MSKIYLKGTKMMMLTFTGLSLLLTSCKKDNAITPSHEISVTKGIYVLCEGGWDDNSSAIYKYKYSRS